MITRKTRLDDKDILGSLHFLETFSELGPAAQKEVMKWVARIRSGTLTHEQFTTTMGMLKLVFQTHYEQSVKPNVVVSGN